MVSRELEKECVVVFDEAHNIDNVCIEVFNSGPPLNLHHKCLKVCPLSQSDASSPAGAASALQNALWLSQPFG